MASRAHLHMPRDLGAKAADLVAMAMGSWHFVIVQTFIVAFWIGFNVWALNRYDFDPYPFILLNLAFSLQAAYASPLILMASNRQAEKDRARDALEAQEVDELYQINKRQLEILQVLHDLQTKSS